MNKICIIAAITLATSGTTAFAASLTPQECHSYPFQRASGQVTHAQLEQEMAELEAAGYHPLGNDPYYPSDIQRAEKRVRAEYRRDCGNASASTSVPG